MLHSFLQFIETSCLHSGTESLWNIPYAKLGAVREISLYCLHSKTESLWTSHSGGEFPVVIKWGCMYTGNYLSVLKKSECGFAAFFPGVYVLDGILGINVSGNSLCYASMWSPWWLWANHFMPLNRKGIWWIWLGCILDQLSALAVGLKVSMPPSQPECLWGRIPCN